MSKITLPLSVTASFSEGFAESLTDAVSRFTLDFASILIDEISRNIVTRAENSPTGLANNLVVTCGISVSDFDAKVSAALRAFRAELQTSKLAHQ